MNTAALRSRVYHDAAPADRAGALQLFERLILLGVADAMERIEPAANGQPAIERVRRDAQSLAAASRQLEYVMTQLYEEPMPDLKMANGDVIDLNHEVPEGAATFTYYLFSGRSMARFSASWSGGNAPMTTINGAQKSGVTRAMESGYAYTMKDLRQAGFANIPLDAMLAKLDRRGHARLLSDTGLWGRMDIGLPGLVNHPNINVIDAPLNAGGSSRTWALKTAAEILADISTLVNTTGQASDGMRRTTHVWLPRFEYDLIAGMMLSTLGTATVLEWALKVFPGVQFGILDELAASKSTTTDGVAHLATDSALALVKNKDVVSLVVPMDYTQHPPQYVDLKVKVPTESMTGGVMLKEPPTVVRMDGIGQT